MAWFWSHLAAASQIDNMQPLEPRSWDWEAFCRNISLHGYEW